MPGNKTIFLITCGLILGPAIFVNAEEKETNFFQSFKGIQNVFERGGDTLQKTLGEVEQLKVEYESEQLGVNPEVTATLKNLRNPFEPQLPVKNIVATQEPLPPEASPTADQTILPPAMPDNAPQLKDRFSAPAKAAVPTKPKFQISALIWNSDRPQAILNGQIVGLGDTLDDWTIVSINKTGVKIRQNEISYVIEP